MWIKGLSCLGMAVAGVALTATATAAAPLTAATVTGALLTGASGGLLHDLFSKGEEAFTKAVFARHPGIDENHHIILALRQAHLKALRAVLAAFIDSGVRKEPDAERSREARRMVEEVEAFLKAAGEGKATGSGPASDLERQVFEKLPESFEHALAERGDKDIAPENFRSNCEGAVLAELLAATNTEEQSLHPSFRELFFAEQNGWFDLFVRDGAARLKDNKDFQAIWQAEQIAMLGANVKTGLAKAEAHRERLAKQAQEDRDAKQAENLLEHGRTQAQLLELMAEVRRLSSEKGVPHAALKRLFIAVGREMPKASDRELERHVRAAVDELLKRAASPAEIGNDPEAIRNAIQIARNKLGSADVDGAVALLLAAEAEQAELLAAQARAAARLPRERAQILKTVYRWDEAIVAFEAAATLDASEPTDHFEIGDIRQSRGNLAGAKHAFEHGRVVAESAGRDRDVSVGHNRIGDVLAAEGKLLEARECFENGLAIAEKLTDSEPANAGLQHDLSVSRHKIGDVFVAEGRLPEARASFEACLTILEKLAGSDPGNAEWQRDLSVSHNKIGDVFVAEGKLPEARGSYKASFAIFEKLAGSDPGNAGWQRDLSVSHDKIGDVFVAEGKLPEARARYEASLAIAEKLAGSDPGNAEWQRDLSVSHERIGDVFVAEGKLPEARGSYEAGLALREKLAGSDPGNAGWQRDLSVSQNKIGDVFVAEGKLPEARGSYEVSLVVREKLAGSDPGNAGWQRAICRSVTRGSAMCLLPKASCPRRVRATRPDLLFERSWRVPTRAMRAGSAI